MKGNEVNDHIADWTGHDLNWDEDELVWAAAHDGGELIEYFTNLLKKMRDHEAQVKATMMRAG